MAKYKPLSVLEDPFNVYAKAEYSPLVLSPCGDDLRCASTAHLSSTLDCGENAGVVVHSVSDIDPDDPTNVVVEIALEWTQAGPQSVRLNNFAFQNM